MDQKAVTWAIHCLVLSANCKLCVNVVVDLLTFYAVLSMSRKKGR